MQTRTFYDAIKPATRKIQDAHDLALIAHKDQKYGQLPYTAHLQEVVTNLERFGFEAGFAQTHPSIESIICAGWLHDVVEDTSITIAEIERQFGFDVSDIVARVSDEPAPSRTERKALTYPKIRGHLGATIVKLADRIANVRSSLTNSESQLQKYQQEQMKFQEAVFVPMMAEPMWDHLNFLINQSFGVNPEPLKSATLYFHKRSDIKIDITAKIENEKLRIEDYAIGSSVEQMFDGDSDYERIVTINAELKDSILLALLQQRFHGNSALSRIERWLTENGIPYESWSG